MAKKSHKNYESHAARSRAAKRGWRNRLHEYNPKSRHKRRASAKMGSITRRYKKNFGTSAGAKKGWRNRRRGRNPESEVTRSLAAKRGWLGRRHGHITHRRNPGGFLGVLMGAVGEASQEFVGGKLINIPANAINNAANLGEIPGYFLKALIVSTPVLARKWLGKWGELATRGAFVLLEDSILNSIIVKAGLPAEIVGLLQSDNVVTRVITQPGMGEIYPQQEPNAFAALAPEGYEYTGKPVLN